MTRILLVGYAPETVDVSDPALPPGITAEAIAAGIERGLAEMRERGWSADFCALRPDVTAGPTLAEHLAAASYDCVVVGGGIRLASKGLAVFETVINTVRRAAPETPIAFNTRPDDSAAAAARWLPAP